MLEPVFLLSRGAHVGFLNKKPTSLESDGAPLKSQNPKANVIF